MNEHDSDHDHDDLAARLRRLPSERVPPAAAWQHIAARLHEAPRERPAAVTPRSRPRPRRRRWTSVAAAAAVAALALLGTGRWWAGPPPQATQATQATRMTQASSLAAQADALAATYRQALAAIPQDSVPAELAPALHELDASAGSIRSAIAQSPDAGFLLGQLRRTYALRLELTRQGLDGAGLST
ncbi:hypothetical protein [Stenotrophomonas acidaminiphila]|uniref:hypothetical protein n=1 Tax=Stenotrophomonas acidaminiphila TaxID=128780 RepID=UPI0028A8D38C|nr:hypothetical protein [Stenotrophomonas acidaminiphila]